MISAIVLTKNEEALIERCLKSLSFADEIIIIDSGSTDKTLVIAKKYTNRVEVMPFTNFSEMRNKGREFAKGDWLLYVDADEEVTPSLMNEIKIVIEGKQVVSAYYITRRNFYLGKEWPVKDRVERLFKKDDLIYWFGEVHESPKINGQKQHLTNELIHRTHNSLEEMLTNTNSWSEFEAKTRFLAKHPSVVWWRIPRMMLRSFWNYYVTQKGYTIGTVGLIESIYQAFSTFVTYGKLWEMQNKNNL